MIDVMKRINTVPFGLHIHLIFVNVRIILCLPVLSEICVALFRLIFNNFSTRNLNLIC